MTEPETGPRGHDIANDIMAIPVLEQLARAGHRARITHK
jgi:hypothetical protein